MRPGGQFGQYILQEKIAEGGMAEIFHAEIRGAHGFVREVCIKRIRPAVSNDRTFVEMFIDEARICSRLRHSNIVSVNDFGELQGTLFVVMEWVHGTDASRVLRAVRADGRRIPVDAALHIVGEVLKALEYAHGKHEQGIAQNIVHRDVSPHNVLVSYAGEVKLADFGIAKATSRLHRTVGDVVKGKVAYMAPEQALGLDLDGRADLFALGVVAYEFLTGDRPFTGASQGEVLDAALKGRRRPLADRRPDASPAVWAFVDTLLATDRDDRYPNATAALDALALLPLASGARTLASLMGHYYPDQASTVRDSSWLQRAPRDLAAASVVASPDQAETAVLRTAPTNPSPTRPSDAQAVTDRDVFEPPPEDTGITHTVVATPPRSIGSAPTSLQQLEGSPTAPSPPIAVPPTAPWVLPPAAGTSEPQGRRLLHLAVGLLAVALVVAVTALVLVLALHAPTTTSEPVRVVPVAVLHAADASVAAPHPAAVASVPVIPVTNRRPPPAVAVASPTVHTVALTVHTHPWAHLRVDDRRIGGDGRLHQLTLPEGTHRLEAFQDDGPHRRRTVLLVAGRPQDVSIDLR